MASSDPPDLPMASPEREGHPRVKLLCSFGGTILPRPLDGRLRYVGGETRIVSLPRDVSYVDLMARMRELFEEDGSFVLKYQQPDEDLDALVSVVNDDDVTNMMEEHDKLGHTSDGFVRLRVFLFAQHDQSSSSGIPSHFDDDRETERRYVDALNCGSDPNPQSPDWDGVRIHQLSGMNRVAMPRRPSHGQLYGDVDGSWSPAAFYSPGQLTPQDYREFSPSPGQFNEYDHAPPFVEGGNLVWVPPGSTVAEISGFPGNLGHSHVSIYDGNGGCEQCRIALQRMQDARYYHVRSMQYGQFHLEQPGEICGTQFVNSCPECICQRDAYLLNQEISFEHEHFDRPTFYNDFHVRDRNWAPHPHQFSHHPEEVRAGRNEVQPVVDGSATNFSSAHCGLYNGNYVPPNCVSHPDSRYAYVGLEQGNEFYPDPYRALPPLRIPRQEEGGLRYTNAASSYGTVGICHAPDRASSVHGSRRNAHGLMGAAPVYEPPPGIMQANGAANAGYPRDTLEETSVFPHVGEAGNLHGPWTGQGGNMAHVNFPIEGVNIPDYALKSNCKIPNQDNSLFGMEGLVQVRAVGGNLGNNEETRFLSSVSSPLLDEKVLDPTAFMNDRFLEVVAGQMEMLVIDADKRQRYEVTELDPNKEKNHLVVDNHDTSISQDRAKEHFQHASVKHIALESVDDVKSLAQADPVVDASSSHHLVLETSHHENMENTQDGCKDGDVDSDNEQAGDFKIEGTAAEKEALAKGLQAIHNNDLEEIRELGSGAYGSVFHGKWKGTDVAIKRIKASCFSGKPSERERLISDFWKEAQILSSLHHPNVVAFYGVVRDGPDGTLATVTEFMVNGSLKQFLQKKDRTIDRRKRLIIAMDASFGMEYLHGKNIVHFDLKCENLLVNMRDPHRPICKEFSWLRCRRRETHVRRIPLDDRLLPYVVEAGFGCISELEFITLDWHLVTALVERWRPETHTFHMPSGEITITLQDVAFILGLRIDGPAVTGETTPGATWADTCEELLGVRPLPADIVGSRVSARWLSTNFSELAEDADELVVQRHARAYILQLLGGVLFTDKSGSLVSLIALPLLQDFEFSGTLSWGSAVLAYLYRHLCLAADMATEEIGGSVILLQLWAWEHFPHIALVVRDCREWYGHPLGVRWATAFAHRRQPTHVVRPYRDAFDMQSPDQVFWTPYTDEILAHLPANSLEGQHIWNAEVPLIYFHIVEYYYPDRFKRQFGGLQDIPSHCSTFPELHAIDLRGKVHVDWRAKHNLHIARWKEREVRIIRIDRSRGVFATPAYEQWYGTITRRFVGRLGATLASNIGDLGLSKVKQKTLVSGGVRGTLPWMAPELLSGRSKMVTEKVDVYSFGVVMWELLTGEDPYADMHCASIIGGIVNGMLRPQIPSWCDPEWKLLMENCWSSDPSERPSFLEISHRLRKMAAAMNLK